MIPIPRFCGMMRRSLRTSAKQLMTFEGSSLGVIGNDEEKMNNVFGGRIKGEPRRSTSRVIKRGSRDIAGIPVPERPIEPDNCCMSGCVNCVWEIYNEDLREWKDRRKQAATKLKGTDTKWPADFDPPLNFLDIRNVPSSLKTLKIKLDKQKQRGASSLFPPREGKLPQSVLDAKQKRREEKAQSGQASSIQEDQNEGWDNIPVFIRVFAEFEKKKKEAKQSQQSG
ncbi:LAQU0S12e03268g1_1 [Lachancea quebecensis]|uniref:LAQU0S12e03268g1_1 n=1 Tax=Lachancea quebecensis TaxID=1654605 RepID=A0A0P1KUM5_9SACH|nr:LAQU0S12e03268g1_1 [Lachancea quebecensis]